MQISFCEMINIKNDGIAISSLQIAIVYFYTELRRIV